MFYFTMLGLQIDLYFWNRLPDYFTSAREACSRLPVEIDVQLRLQDSRQLAGYWAT